MGLPCWLVELAAFVFLCLPSAGGITWTSSSTLPDGHYVTGCRGQDLYLLWGYQLDPGESYVTDTEWWYTGTHVPHKHLLAFRTQANQFMADPSAPVTVQDASNSTWNLAIVIPQVTPQYNGRYEIEVNAAHSSSSAGSSIPIGGRQSVIVKVSDSPVLAASGFHASVVVSSVRVTSSGNLHVQLSCGTLDHLGQPPVSVMWKTPDNSTVNSTSNQNGVFFLDVEGPHPDGDYSCFIPDTSNTFSCLEASSPLRGAAHVTVRENELRPKLVAAQLSQLTAQNANLTQLVQGLLGQMKSVTQANSGLVTQLQTLQQQQTQLEAERGTLTTKVDGLSRAVDALKADNAQLQQANSDLMAQMLHLNGSGQNPSVDLQDYKALPQNCQDVRHYNNSDGQHTLFTRGRVYHAYCDQTTDGGGWTVIQRRLDGSVDFYRDWRDYENGFGDVTGEYWLGLEKLWWLTSSNTYKLRVHLTHYDGSQAMALYSAFSVSDAANHYTLHVSGYSGNAGDSLRLNNNRGFSTFDNDNDLSAGNCATVDHGGFWYGDCTNVNVNGRYYRTAATAASAGDDGVYWFDWKSNTNSLKSIVMMVKAM